MIAFGGSAGASTNVDHEVVCRLNRFDTYRNLVIACERPVRSAVPSRPVNTRTSVARPPQGQSRCTTWHCGRYRAGSAAQPRVDALGDLSPFRIFQQYV